MTFRVTYVGEGITSNALGVFQRHTTARTQDEPLARSLAQDRRWEVQDETGTRLGQQEEPQQPSWQRSFQAAAVEALPGAEPDVDEGGSRRSKRRQSEQG